MKPADTDQNPLTDEEQRLLALFEDEPLPTEALLTASGLEAGELSLLLMNLELSGAVRRLPGKRYVKI